MAGTTVPGRLSWRIATVVESRVEGAHATTLVLDVPGWPGHQAGQHIDVRLTAEDGYQAERSYSIASAPNGQLIELTIERIDEGEVSPYLTGELRAGDQLELRGPIGGYFAWNPSVSGPLMLVAGGSGIVPLMAIIRTRAAAGVTVPTRFLASFRTEADVIYGKEIAALTAKDPTLEVQYTLTRTAPAHWPGYTRRVDHEMLVETVWPPARAAHTYVCGPTPFVEAVAASLVELGHDPSLIRTERFGPSGG